MPALSVSNFSTLIRLDVIHLMEIQRSVTELVVCTRLDIVALDFADHDLLDFCLPLDIVHHLDQTVA